MEGQSKAFSTSASTTPPVSGPSRAYSRLTQTNAIDFVHYVTNSISFCIREMRADNGHGFQAKFH